MSEVEPTVLLNAAVFLASPPGAQRGQALPRQLRSPECHSLLLRGRAGHFNLSLSSLKNGQNSIFCLGGFSGGGV